MNWKFWKKSEVEDTMDVLGDDLNIIFKKLTEIQVAIQKLAPYHDRAHDDDIKDELSESGHLHVSNDKRIDKLEKQLADTETKLRELEKQHEYHYTDTHKPLNAKITDLENKVNYLEEAAVDFAKVDGKLEDQIADLGTQNQINVTNITRQNQKLDKHLADFRLHMDDLDKAIQENTRELNNHYKTYLTQKEIEDLIQHHEANK